MNDLTLAVQLDLALHLGLIGAMIGLAAWRLAGANDALNYFLKLVRVRRSGFYADSARLALRLIVVELACKVIGLAIAVNVFLAWFKYVRLTELLVGPDSGAFDSGLFEILWQRSEGVTEAAVFWSAMGCLTFFLDCVFSFSAPWVGGAQLSVPYVEHQHVINAEWNDAPAAMWEQRIDRMLDAKIAGVELDQEAIVSLSSDRWRSDWCAWAECVVIYSRFAWQESESSFAPSLYEPRERSLAHSRSKNEPEG
jgi:hypothetical protein